jgi:SAM-dependent methyltransferase
MPLRLKADMHTWLHRLREREMSMVFRDCPAPAFGRTLELGAGDGFISTILRRYTVELISTDYQPGILQRQPAPGVIYRVADAERVDEIFAGEQFDLIFSSNMLEHLTDPERALIAMERLLAPGGITIHFVPNRLWLALFVLLHVPSKLANIAEALTGPNAMSSMRGKIRGDIPAGAGPTNNPKTVRPRRSVLSRLLLPEPHGVSPTLISEWATWGTSRWRARFAAAGLEVVSIRNGPCSSGHGFGWERLQRIAEACGFASETVFITCRPAEIEMAKRKYGWWSQTG